MADGPWRSEVCVRNYRLASEIIQRSEAKSWDEAKLEWALSQVYEADEPEACLCGHFPIVELCELENRRNGAHAVVGNCCVKRFVGLPSDKIFQSVRRIRKDSSKSLNAEAIQHAHQRGWINDWEKEFYFDVMRRQKLSTKQRAKKLQINRLVLERMKRRTGRWAPTAAPGRG